MFTTRMHERYQFVVLIFLLGALIVHKSRDFFYLYLAHSIIILANHLIPMFHWNNGGSGISESYYGLMVFFSVLNLLLYVVSSYITFKHLFSKTQIREATLCDIQP